MVRKLLFILGRLFSFVFPYYLNEKIRGANEIIYSGWISKKIVHLGRNSKFGFGLHLCGVEMISIGEDVYFGKDFALTSFNGCEVSKHLTIDIGNHCMFGNGNHITAACGITIDDGFRSVKGVLISDNSHGDPLVGGKAAILSGVSIGDGTIIGAKTVVTHNV